MSAVSVPRPAGGPDGRTLVAFAAVVLFGGLNTVAVKVLVGDLAPEWSAALRFLGAGAIFLALSVGQGRALPRGRSLAGAALYGVVGYAGAFGLISLALQRIPAGTAAVVIALAPLFTYGLAIAQGQEVFRPRALLGAAIALAGVGIVFVEQLGTDVPPSALVVILVGVACIAQAAVIAKRIPRADPVGTNAVAMLAAGVLLLAGSFLGGEVRAAPTTSEAWAAIGYLTVFGSVVMFGLYLYGLGRWTASGMSYSTLLLPFVSVTVATLLTGEAFSPAFVVGSLVMLGGVYLGAFGIHRPARSTATSMPECLPMADCAAPLPSRRAATRPA
jgi:drug/metabolite transporter (DMT)-like permease